MSRFVDVYEDESFTVTLEEREGMLFLHCEAEDFSKSVYKQMKEVMEEIKQACIYFGWDRVFSYTPNPKFARMLGGKSIEKFTVAGRDYEVMVWELKQQ